MTDIEISHIKKLENIIDIAKKLDIKQKDLELYGDYKAKIKNTKGKKNGKLILVTATNPTSAGEGKTTVSIGLSDALSMLNLKTCLTLREPSLGPVFGVKGGATGGGYSQIAPMEDINLHFTGDFHAITSANNLLCALIDNHIFQGNELQIDPNRIVFNRCLDVNDRALRDVTICPNEKYGTRRQEKFIITAASEIMAILCMARDLNDLKLRLSKILVAYDVNGNPIYAHDLKAEEAMTILLKDAIKPNLVQTLGGTPTLVHGGPFANIAHGCNSIIALKTALSHADFVVTEAGFGAELGAQKFFDTICRMENLKPNVVVMVTTVRAMKLHGGMDKNSLKEVNLKYLKAGFPNLKKHLENIRDIYHLPIIVAINFFKDDSKVELDTLKDYVKNLGFDCVVANVWGKGGRGALDLAKKVKEVISKNKSNFSFSYNLEWSVEKKIKEISKKIYGAKDVEFTPKAREDLKEIKRLKLQKLPIIMAKTQYSLSDNAKLLGAPTDFILKVRAIKIQSGAGFLIPIAGHVLLMPGLPKVPAGIKMKITGDVIEGLF